MNNNQPTEVEGGSSLLCLSIFTYKYPAYFIFSCLYYFIVDCWGMHGQECSRRCQTHGPRPPQKARAAKAGAEGESLLFCFIFLIFTYPTLFISLSFFLQWPLRSEVLAEVDRGRQGRAPSLNCPDTRTDRQGRYCGKRLWKLAAMILALWYVFSVAFFCYRSNSPPYFCILLSQQQ